MMGGVISNIFGNNGEEVQHFSNPDVHFYPNRATGVAGERDNAKQLINEACNISTYRENDRLLIKMIRSYECVAPGSNMLISTDVLGGGGTLFTYEWRWSFDGVNYSSVLGTDDSFLYTAQSFPHSIFIQVTVTAEDGRVETGTIIVSVNPYCPNVQEGNRAMRVEKNEWIKSSVIENVLPNPADDRVSISINLKEKGSWVSLRLCNAKGTVIKNIANRHLNKGRHEFEIDVSQFLEGIYYVTLVTDQGVDGQKLLVIR